MAKKATVVSKADFIDAQEDNMGFCLVCKEFTRDCTEPDACYYDCPECENDSVFGAEQSLLEGLITF